MKPFPQTSLFLTTYNWPEALELCLQSISKQTVLPNEVIIADDGSGEPTKKVIEKLKHNFPIPIKHIWQEDNGYRINAIRNKAISNASFPYIIQIDGDVILEKHFIEDHLCFSRKGRLLAGRRIRIDQNNTDDFCKNGHYSEQKHTRNKLLAILHHRLLYNSKSVRGIRGCNMSYWKEDAYLINGYDEDMNSKGPNDKEFSARLVNIGVKVYNLKFFANQFHLEHGEEDRRTNYEFVKGLLQEAIKSGKTQCKNGLSQK